MASAIATEILPESNCPVCTAEVKLFYINFEEQFRMCVNTTCYYPFGYKKLEFVRPENPWHDAIFTIYKPSTAVASASAASAEMCKTEDDIKTGKKNHDMDIQKQLAEIKELYNELYNLVQENKEEIKISNQKWLKELGNIQELSGVQMLKPGELVQFKEDLGKKSDEWQVDVDAKASKIVIRNKAKSTPKIQ